MDDKLLDYILEVHENAESYTKTEILLDLFEMYPKWDDVKYELVHNENICPYCGENLLIIKDNTVSDYDYPLIIARCSSCYARF